MKIFFFLVLGVLSTLGLKTVNADQVKSFGNFTQGELVRGKVSEGVSLGFMGRKIRVGKDGFFIFGLGRDFPGIGKLIMHLPDGTQKTHVFSVTQRKYKIQHINGLPSKMVTPSHDNLIRIREENKLIADARANDGPEAFFRGGFIWPLVGLVTGVFGSQRVLNGQPRRPHYGIDIAAPLGTRVIAPTGGVVVMAEINLFYTGGTVILDHGYGLVSVYSHLDEIDVEIGQRVSQKTVLGSVGSTGRSTGPHLDWRINWFNQRLDPALLVGQMPNTQNK